MSRGNEIERAPSVAVPSDITQTTAVEQARARAEVEAAVYVAQKFPRDMARAEAEMRDACGRFALADRAFYAVPNRGTGPTVHLARELARIWGNIDYGVHELRRDDSAGMSEIRAFAWDLQTNARSTRTFQVPHARMKKVNNRPTREPLFDLGDVYLNNQNIGSRAVRECIMNAIPAWFRDLAQDLCRATLKQGDGTPLQDRIANMISTFRGIGVTVNQLEQRTGLKRGQWTADDVTQLGIAFASIQRGELQRDDEFPQQRVTGAEITGQQQSGLPPAAPPAEPEITPEQAAADAAWLAGDNPQEPTEKGDQE